MENPFNEPKGCGNCDQYTENLSEYSGKFCITENYDNCHYLWTHWKPNLKGVKDVQKKNCSIQEQKTKAI